MKPFRIGSGLAGALAIALVFGIGTSMAVSAAAGKQGQSGSKKASEGTTAIAHLKSADDPKLSGTVTFTQEGDKVHVVAHITGIDKPGQHAFHVHEKGDCTAATEPGKSYTSAGGHFNPAGAPHACPDAAQHHAGDFGNVEVGSDGTAHVDVTTSAISLSGPDSVIGKAVILHAGTDDCTSQPAGNAGARLACGVVKAGGH